MGFGRVLSSCLALVAVAGCAAVAIGLGQAASGPGNADTDAASVAPTFEGRSYPPTTWTWSTTAAAISSARTVPTSHPATRSATPSATPTVSSAKSSTSAPSATSAARTSSTTSAPTVVRGQSLPLGSSTGLATRVITVVAHSYGSTTATLQAWVKAPGGGWLKHGSAVLAHVGAQGLTTQPSESKSATPIGSFTLTQAFGAYSNPGTGLPYFRTTSADWWISEAGSLYNTHQHCSSGCSFNTDRYNGPNEPLADYTPQYNYAVVINTPSGAAAYPHGSAFFLHVTDGAPTAGCVAISQSTLVSLMQWLTPTAHPRILIGVA